MIEQGSVLRSAAVARLAVARGCFFASLSAALLVPVQLSAQAGGMPGPRHADFSTLKVEVEAIDDRFVVLREQPAAPTVTEPSKGKKGKDAERHWVAQFPGPEEALGGSSPWPFFAGVFDEAGCHSPRLAAGARVAAAICGGKGNRGPRVEYAVVREGKGVRLYRVPVASVGDALALSADGRSLAVVVDEDGENVVHVVDLRNNRFLRVRGPWAEPQHVFLSRGGGVLALGATIGRFRAVVLVNLAEKTAVQGWPEGGDAALLGLSDDGSRLLVRNKRIDFEEVFLVDPARGVIFDISERSGEVISAALHGGASQIVFSAEIGGACGLYWADLVIRRRSSILGSIEDCYGATQIDRERRFLLYEQRRGRERLGLRLKDRRSRRAEAHMELPKSCEDPFLDAGGRYLAAYCEEGEREAGLFLFSIVQERQK